MAGHELQDRTSMALARAIVARLDMDPSLLDIARQNLERWTVRNADSPHLLACYREWEAILVKGLDAVREVLLSESDEGQRLRQNSPFPGVLSPQEVWEIKRKCRNDASAA